MEVGLPAHQVVLVDPAHVPYAGAGQGDGGITGPLGAQPVLRVVPLDEHRQRQADGPYRLGRDQTGPPAVVVDRSEEHTSELQSRGHLVCRLLLDKKNKELEKKIMMN